MTTFNTLLMLVALACGTMLCRFILLILPKTFLASQLLQKLNKMLPLVIMLLLILTSLHLPNNENKNYALLIAEILALISVVLSYKWFHNILFSVTLGIININFFLYFLN